MLFRSTQTGGFTFNSVQDETGVATDSIVVNGAYSVAFQDVLSILDSSINSIIISPTVSETVNAVDTITNTAIYNNLLFESGYANDTISAAGSIYHVAVVEALSASDSVSARLLWEIIDDTDDAHWGSIDTSNVPVWSAITTTQTPNWNVITDTQASGWTDVTTTQSPNWNTINT